MSPTIGRRNPEAPSVRAQPLPQLVQHLRVGAANDRPHVPREEPEPGSTPEVHADYTLLRNNRGDKSSVPVLVWPLIRFPAKGPVEFG